MHELNESFQNMLNDEGDHSEGNSLGQRASQTGPPVAPEEQTDEAGNPQSQSSREQVLQRLQGQDTQLEAGLKVTFKSTSL